MDGALCEIRQQPFPLARLHLARVALDHHVAAPNLFEASEKLDKSSSTFDRLGKHQRRTHVVLGVMDQVNQPQRLERRVKHGHLLAQLGRKRELLADRDCRLGDTGRLDDVVFGFV